MSEKSNCPNGNWQTCAQAGNTGHYINLSRGNAVWVGIGESNPMPSTQIAQDFGYGGLISYIGQY